MKKLLIGTNTKMTKTISETKQFLTELQELTNPINETEISLFVIPSFTTLVEARSCITGKSIALGAQNISWGETGQFTGEISPRMLDEIGIDMVMIGHSERRHVLKEDDFMVNLKVLNSLKHGFITLLCVGETKIQKEYGIADETLRTQILIALKDVDPSFAKQLIIAYEPVWAIGEEGIPATKEYAQEKHLRIKQVLNDRLGKAVGETVPVLYGGSVNSENAEDLISMDGIDGLFVGRSAWDALKFSQLIQKVLPHWKKRNQ
ncbi:MAG: triose-phosphate isomerase [Sphaerochaeta sp.]